MFRIPYRRLPPERLVADTPSSAGWFSKLVHLIARTPAASEGEARSYVGESTARPYVSVRIRGPAAARRLKHALLDAGSQDTLFPAELAERLGIVLGGEQQAIRWRGQRFAVEFQIVELEIAEGGTVWRWRARAGFTPAPLAYALIGQRGCLEFLDATFRGADQVVELDTNRAFPGTVISGT